MHSGARRSPKAAGGASRGFEADFDIASAASAEADAEAIDYGVTLDVTAARSFPIGSPPQTPAMPRGTSTLSRDATTTGEGSDDVDARCRRGG